MLRYGLHINHPSNKARIHVVGGCASVQKAFKRAQAGEPYGPVHGEENGQWKWFETLQEAEAAQQESGKTLLDRCKRPPCRDQFPQ